MVLFGSFYRQYLSSPNKYLWFNQNITNQIISRKHNGDLFTLLVNGPSPFYMYRGRSSLQMVKNFEPLWFLGNYGDFATISDLDRDSEDEIACFGSFNHVLAIKSLKYFKALIVLKDIYTTSPRVVWQKLIHEGFSHYPYVSILAEDIDNDGIIELITATQKNIKIFKSRG